jgi:hypothetical protein
MYLQVTDLIAITIALGVSVTLIITTAIQNARITKSRNDWRQSYLQMYSIMSDPRMMDCECESK